MERNSITTLENKFQLIFYSRFWDETIGFETKIASPILTRVYQFKMNTKPPTMVQSKSRPLTSRTRKKIEQLEEDENLAMVMAMEEDEKIAAK
jgi:hypothetical protein